MLDLSANVTIQIVSSSSLTDPLYSIDAIVSETPFGVQVPSDISSGNYSLIISVNTNSGIVSDTSDVFFVNGGPRYYYNTQLINQMLTYFRT